MLLATREDTPTTSTVIELDPNWAPLIVETSMSGVDKNADANRVETDTCCASNTRELIVETTEIEDRAVKVCAVTLDAIIELTSSVPSL
jgi:hypothetical protein